MTDTPERSFRLLDEGWIECSTRDGTRQELGLLEIFGRAAELREIVDASPLVRVALHRPLLAVLYRTQQIETLDDWLRLWRDGWDAGAIIRYLEKWRDRFDLFSTRYPFWQRWEMDLAGDRTPFVKSGHQFASGNNKQVFDHSHDEVPNGFSPSQAARMLVCLQSWAIGGGKSGGDRPYFTTAPLPRGACIIPLGNSLRETLLLNLVPTDALASSPRSLQREDAEDSAVWERDEPILPKQTVRGKTVAQRPLRGVADYLTWPFRYVRLVRDDDGHVRWCFMVQGEAMDMGEAEGLVDPFHAYEKSKESGFIPKSVSKDKQVWRDSTALFGAYQESQERGSCSALGLLRQVRPRAPKGLPNLLPVFVAGVAVPGGQPPPDVWIGETFWVPSMITGDPRLQDRLEKALGLANRGRDVVRGAIYAYAVQLLKHENDSFDQEAAGKFSKSLFRETDYWAALEIPFHHFLRNFAEDLEAENPWRKSVVQSAQQTFDSSLASQDSTGRHLKALNAALGKFRFELKKNQLTEDNSDVPAVTAATN